MYQVSLLSSEVGKSSDLLGGKGDAANKNQTNGNAFSDAMEQHYPKKTTTEADNKNSKGGNLESKAAEQSSLTDKSGAVIKQIRNDLGDAHTLPVPLPVEDDSSIGGSATASKSATLPVSFVIDNETMSAKLKAEKSINDDAHTLPVPLPIDDESLVTNPLAESAYIITSPITAEEKTLKLAEESILAPVINKKGNEHTLPVPVAPTQDKNKIIIGNEATLNAGRTEVNSQKVTLVSSSQQELKAGLSVGQNVGQSVGPGVDKNTENDETVDLLKMLNGAQKLLTKSAQDNREDSSVNNNIGNNTNKNVGSSVGSNVDNTDVKSNVQQSASDTTTKVSVESEQVKSVEVGKNITFASALETKMSADNKLSDQASNTNNLTANTEKQTTESTTDKTTNLVDDNTEKAKNKFVDNSVISNSQSVAVNTPDNNTQASKNNITKAIELAVSQENLTDESTEIKKALAAEQAAVQLTNIKNDATAGEQTKKLTEAQATVSKVSTGETNEPILQTTELKKDLTADSNRANASDTSQRPQVNQSTATVIPATPIDKNTDGSQKNTVIDETAKLASTSDDEQALMKSSDDKNTNQTEKAVSAFNPLINPGIDAQAARTITSAEELNAYQEKSFENTINQLNTNTVQTQKSITAMNTETIAIYRKDFADAVKDKVMVMINQKIQQVEIQLDPPEMGNIHVKVNLQNEQAAVQFVVQNQQAKEALEQNMGKLRDMLAQSGVDVGEANIEQRQASEQNEQGFKQTNNNGTNAESAEDNFSDNGSVVLDVVKASSTGVDYYA